MSKQKPDPKALGLKCGLEIHQQLNTHKLFCNCPSIIREDKEDFAVTRTLRASAGESGETDISALHETKKKKTFKYLGYQDSTCLVELDEEPPHEINQEALHIGMQVAQLTDSKIYNKTQVMRKTVVDGSNTSGFQRTVLFAQGGSIKGDWGSASIQAICLEEDSAKIVSRTSKQDTYNLSRLGIPLIELATGPDLTTPEMVQSAAAHIGMLLRSTRNPITEKTGVLRGLGTIRQDINISIAKGDRVEIKGAQDLKLIPELVNNEMLRQQKLLELDLSINKPEIVDLTSHFSSAKGFVGKLLQDKNQKAIGIKLTSKAGILGTELFDGYRVGVELAGYAKANGFGGIIHSDEQEEKYGVSFTDIHKALNNKEGDAWLVLVGEQESATRVLQEVIIPRMNFQGIPQEVRKANADATTTYLRPMPGASRMYPETDVPIVVTPQDVKKPKILSEQINDFAKKHNLSEALAKEAFDNELFTTLTKEFPKIKAEFIAQTIITTPKEIKKREKKELTQEQLMQSVSIIFKDLDKIPKSAVYDLLVDVVNNKKVNTKKYEQVSKEEIEEVVKQVIAKDPNAPIGALMGQAMAQLQGRADGKIVMQILQQQKK